VASPVHFVAGSTSSVPVVAMQIYEDDSLVYQNSSNSIDTFLTITPGTHSIVVKGWQSSGTPFSKPLNITVSSSSAPAPSIQLSASPASISAGQSVTLSWSSTNASSVNIQPGIGAVGASGTVTVPPSGTTTYVATATGAGGSSSSSATVMVQGGSGCSGANGTRSVMTCSPVNGSTVVSPVHVVAASTSNVAVVAMQIYDNDNLVYSNSSNSLDTYLTMPMGSHYLVVKAWEASGGDFFTPLTIQVGSLPSPTPIPTPTPTPTPAPAIQFSASPTSIAAGQSSILSWSTTNATSVDIEPGVGVMGPSGSVRVTPSSSTTYTATATGSGGNSSSAATVTVQTGGCALNSQNPSVTVCMPANGASLTSPVHVVAGTTSSVPVVAMQVYEDDQMVYQNSSNSIDTSLAMTTRSHYLVIKGWQSNGTPLSTALTINVVANSNPAPTIQLSATPSTISTGQSATLSWSTTNATSVDIEPEIGKVSASGSATLTPNRTTTYTATATGTGGNTSASTIITVAGPPSLQSINHIIYMLQENRSFDHYFGMLNVYRQAQGLPAEVDGLLSGAQNLNFDGTAYIQAFHMNSVCELDLSPAWNESHISFNRTNPTSSTGLNDGFASTAGKFARDSGYWDVLGQRTMGYYDWTQLAYYYFMATQFAMSDRWFSPAPTRTAPNRYYAVSGTSAGHAYPSNVGLTNRTIFDELEQAGISWKVYEGTPGNTILGDWQGFTGKYTSHFVDVSQFATDAANGTLPAVSLIEQKQNFDEHPGNNIQQGSAYVASLINSLMTSQSWKDSVFILTWDEGGDFYDHVPSPPAHSPDGIPPQDLVSTDIQGDFTRYGFRVPNIVISPFTKAHYVSHTVMDTTAILKLIETRFNLPSLTARDGNSLDMTEFFDFQNVPWRTPPSPPIQPTNGGCYYDHLP